MPRLRLSLHDVHLAPLLARKLPESMRIEWYKKSTSPLDRFNLQALLEFSLTELEARESVVNTEPSTSSSSKLNSFKLQRKSNPKHDSSTLKAFLCKEEESKPNKCKICESGDHPAFHCQKLLSFSVEKRRQAVLKSNLCYNCLRGHLRRDCRSSSRCSKCGGNHNTLLHLENCKSKSSEVGEESKTNLASSIAGSARAVLQTALVRTSKGGQVRILFDTGSELSYVSEEAVRRHRPPLCGRKNHKMEVFGGTLLEAGSREVYRVTVGSLHDDSSWVDLQLICLRKLCRSHPGISSKMIGCALENNVSIAELADIYDGDSMSIDIILGLDHIPLVMKDEAPVRIGRLFLQSTMFGLVLGGFVGDQNQRDTSLVAASKVLRASQVSKDLETLANSELNCIFNSLDESEVPEVEPEFKDGRYEVSLPWITEARPHFSETQAQRRLGPSRKMSAEKLKLI